MRSCFSSADFLCAGSPPALSMLFKTVLSLVQRCCAGSPLHTLSSRLSPPHSMGTHSTCECCPPSGSDGIASPWCSPPAPAQLWAAASCRLTRAPWEHMNMLCDTGGLSALLIHTSVRVHLRYREVGLSSWASWTSS